MNGLRHLLLPVLLVLLAGCEPVDMPGPQPMAMRGPQQFGYASYYSDNLQGHPTASGVSYDRRLLTAASRTLPLGSRVRVTHAQSGRWVEVTVNDRMGNSSRIINLSFAAADWLGMIRQGVAPVRLDLLYTPQPQYPMRTIARAPRRAAINPPCCCPPYSGQTPGYASDPWLRSSEPAHPRWEQVPTWRPVYDQTTSYSSQEAMPPGY